MSYTYLPYEAAQAFTIEMFVRHGFSTKDSHTITEVLLCADLFGIESHGIQRLIRYHHALKAGEVNSCVQPLIVHDTPVSAVMDAQRCIGHVAGVSAMRLAIHKAKSSGIGMVTVRNSSHYGIAGYYTTLTLEEDMMGISLTNTEAISPPTFGKHPMLGTNPIAFAMPADPMPFWFDASTTVVPLGKMEVYLKQDKPLPSEWAIDSEGEETLDAAAVIANLRSGLDGGLLTLGGIGETHGGHKGYGLSVMVDICTALLSGGLTAPSMKGADGERTSHFFAAVDYGLFGDKATIRKETSKYLDQLRNSAKAKGQKRIYTHGEKAWESKQEKFRSGISVQDKTLKEMHNIASELKMDFHNYFA